MSTGNSPYSPDPNSNHIYAQYVVLPSVRYGYPMPAEQCPNLAILEQPQSKFRFRYKSEMTGTHGSIMAESNDRNRKSPVKVQVQNYAGGRPVTVRCSLVTNPTDSSVPIPHVHKLVGDGKDEDDCYQDVSEGVNWTATFQGITIIHTAKKQVKDVLAERLSKEKLHELQSQDNSIMQLTKTQQVQVNDMAEKMGTNIDLHSVRLKFEAFYKDFSPMESACDPVYSTPISNLKCTQAGDLRIVRIDKIVSCCTGNEEVFIFVEKVNKRNIQIRFFEQDSDGNNIWQALADFSELDVHHQYAIVFRTPPYKDLNIKDDVDVMLELYRPSDSAVSEAKSFKYKPQEHVHRAMRLPGGKRQAPSPSPYEGPEKQPKQSPDFFSSQSPPNGMDDSSNGSNPGDGGKRVRSVLNPGSVNEHNDMSWIFPLTTHMQQNQPEQCVTHPGVGQEPIFTGVAPGFYTPYQPPNLVYPITDQFVDLDDMLRQNFPVVKNEPYLDFTGPELAADMFSNFLLEQLTTDAVKSKGPSPLPPASGKPDERNVNVTDVSDALGKLALGTAKEDSLIKAEENVKKGGEEPESTQTMNLHMAQAVSLNMAYALRYFACTGNLSVLLNRMHHLLAIQSEDGDNALHASLVNYQTEAFRLILQAALSDKSDQEMISAPNDKGQTPLHVAALTNHPEAVRALLNAGANLDAKDGNGNTAYHLAASDPHLLDCLASLLEPKKTHQLNVLNSQDGMTPLHLAVRVGSLNAVQILCKAKADVNVSELKQGRTALQMAIEKNFPEIIDYLLKSTNVNVNVQAYDGTTVLHLAILGRKTQLVTLLMASGANPALRRIQVDLDSEGDSEEEDEEEEFKGAEGDEDEGSEEEVVPRGQTAWTMAQNEPTILAALQADYTKVPVEVLEEPVREDRVWVMGQTGAKDDKRPDPMDSGVDLMSSREFTSRSDLAILPNNVVVAVATLIDPPEIWKPLAKALKLEYMTSFIGQTSPGTYLLKNMEELELSGEEVVDKLRQLKLNDAANLLERGLNL